MTRPTNGRRKKSDRVKAKSPHRAAGGNRLAAAIVALGIVAAIAAWQWLGALWGFKKAPSFTLQSSMGRAVSLEDFRRKQEIVLLFYMGAG